MTTQEMSQLTIEVKQKELKNIVDEILGSDAIVKGGRYDYFFIIIHTDTLEMADLDKLRTKVDILHIFPSEKRVLSLEVRLKAK